MMEIVIKIPEEEYRWIKKSDSTVFADISEKECMLYAIKNGRPLSKPHGEWLDKKMTIKGGHGLAYGRYGCSVCKKKQPSKTDFCPNCGADMRESEEEE